MAVTVSLSNTKIDVISTGGVQETLEAVYQAVIAIDSARMTRTGSGTSGDPYVYTIPPKTGQVYCELEISSGCKVLCQNSGSDYSRLDWTWGTTTGTYYVFDLASGGEIAVEVGFKFDFDTAGTHRGYCSWYGKATLLGASGNEIILKHMRSHYFYPREDQNLDHVKIQDTTYPSGYMFYRTYPQATTVRPTNSYTNITIENSSNYWGYIYFIYGGIANDNDTYSNWYVDHVAYPITCQGTSIKISNSTFIDSSIQGLIYAGGNCVGNPFNTSKTKLVNARMSQPMIVFDNCTFDDLDGGAYGMYVNYSSTVLFKDCDFSNQSVGVYASYAGIAIWQGTSTFTSVTTPKYWGGNGTHLHAKALSINVKDMNGENIEGASVAIREKSDRYEVSFITESDGNICNIWGDDPILIEKEETSAGVYETWDDYEVVITAKGCQTWQRDITADQDNELNVVLQPASSPNELPVQF